jgi:hypothetical protein
MRFFYLAEIDKRYNDEEGTPGERNRLKVWLPHVTLLKKCITDLRNELQRSSTPAPIASPTSHSSVKDRIRFFETVERRAAGSGNQQRIEHLRTMINKLRKMLQMEGVSTDKDGNITKIQHLVVVYDRDATKQGMTQVQFQGGRLYLKGQPLETDNMVTHTSGPGKAIYVLSFQGNMHVASHVVGHRHHSSLLAGRGVAGAGEIEVHNGHVQWISNKSGHYCPSVCHFLQTLHLLQKKGVPMTFRVKVLSFAPEIQGDYPSVGAFLKRLESLGEPDYELAKLLRYQEFLTDEFLGRNGWRWRHADRGEEAGVYTIATNQFVPHKVVRQWFKSQGLLPEVAVQRGAAKYAYTYTY